MLCEFFHFLVFASLQEGAVREGLDQLDDGLLQVNQPPNMVATEVTELGGEIREEREEKVKDILNVERYGRSGDHFLSIKLL